MVKYIILSLLISGCCSHDKSHHAKMFANGARNYCGEIYAQGKSDKDDCEDVYKRFYSGW